MSWAIGQPGLQNEPLYQKKKKGYAIEIHNPKKTKLETISGYMSQRIQVIFLQRHICTSVIFRKKDGTVGIVMLSESSHFKNVFFSNV